MRVAIVSDIHGNETALEAVLADLKPTSPTVVVHGGATWWMLGRGQVETVDQIRTLGWKGVAGPRSFSGNLWHSSLLRRSLPPHFSL
jgi:hypothetical protein